MTIITKADKKVASGVWASAVSSAFDRAHAEVRTGVGGVGIMNYEVGSGVWGE